MTVSDVVGAVMAAVTEDELASAARRDVQRPTVFVRSLQEPEVVAFARRLKEYRLSGQQGSVETRVGTTRVIEGLPEDMRLGRDRTLTSYRNSNEFGLVLVDLDPFSDAQGLSNLRTLDDSTVLGELDEDVRTRRIRTLVECAWTRAIDDQERQAPPQLLVTRVGEIHELLSRLGTTSLRVWVRYAVAAAEALAADSVAVHTTVDRVVGEVLSAVGLFPDPNLFGSGHTIKKRLQDNFNLSQNRGPTGREIPEEELVELVRSVDLPPDLLAATGQADPDIAKTRMLAVVEGGGETERAAVPLDLWLRLFEVRPDRTALGARVRQHFEVPGDRLAEFDDLGVETALDNGEQEAADILLRAEPIGDSPALADLLPAVLRRRVEKLAIPRAVTQADPLRAVLYGLQALERASSSDSRVVTLSREVVRDGEGDLSTAVFAFLYGPTLRELATVSLDGLGTRLEVEDAITDVAPIGGLGTVDTADESQTDPATRWSPLRLVLRADGQMDPLYRFQWRPLENAGLIAFTALVASGDVVPVGSIIDATLEDWAARAFDLQAWTDGSLVPGPSPDVAGPLVESWLADRAMVHAELTVSGVDENILGDYLSRWEATLEAARLELTPTGSPLTELEQFLSIDMVELTGGRLAMLGTHPLRLRWLAAHLHNMKRHIIHSLDSGLDLNPQNDQLFFDWLDRVSPHRQPPFVSGPRQQLAIPVRESGLHEEYALIHAGGAESRDWLSGIDDASVDAVAGVVRNYLDSYPHKRDGLRLLLLLRDGDPAVASRLLNQVRVKDYSEARVVLHVLTARRHHDAIGREIEDLLSGGAALPDRFMPDVELMLHDWRDAEDSPDLSHLLDTIDIAIAPNLFGTKTSAQPSTRRRDTGLAGNFNPWIDVATHDQRLGDRPGENVSKVLLPVQPDPVLEAWSTLSVRRFRNAAVSNDADGSTDYLELQVQFHVGAPLFEALHAVSHWVVTLDPFVGRDQIDALQGRPDVILVRGGVGKNRTYTLVVSSKTGSRHVTDRLARKLERDFRIELPTSAHQVAARLYEVGRNSFPGIMLRALGLGRAGEEVLGLIVSRFAVESRLPAPTGPAGLEWWLSLDERTEWFGGPQRSRADLLRVVAVFDGEEVSLRLHVIESKFRSLEDAAVVAIADQQLNRTIELLTDAFRVGRGEDRGPDDGEFWMRELVEALDQTSKAQLPASELPALRMFGGGTMSQLRDALLSGRFELDEVLGVAVGIAYNSPGPVTDGATAGGHQLIRLASGDLRDVLRQIVDPTGGASVSQVDLPSPPSAPEVGTTPDLANTEDEGVSEPQPAGGGSTSGTSARPGGMSQTQLNDRYQRVLDVFAAHGIRVGQPAGEWTDEGPGFYVLRVVPDVGVSVDKLLNRNEDLKLALRLEANQQVRAFVDRGSVVFEVPKADHERYAVETSSLWQKTAWREDALYVPVGEDINGGVVGVEFSSSDSPHLLIGGATGSGKSVLLETLLRGVTHQYPPDVLRLHLVDPKGTELVDFEGSPHLAGAIGFSSEDAVELLDRAVEEMQWRYERFKAAKVRSLVQFNEGASPETRIPWWLLVLDEYADLTSDAEDKLRIERSLKRLAQKARAAGIHLVVATQKPSAEVISTTVRSNLPAQIALRVKTASDSRIIMDEAGAESLAGKGDAFFKSAKGLVRLQCAWFDGDG